MSAQYDPHEKIWLAKKLEERKARKAAEAAARAAAAPAPAEGPTLPAAPDTDTRKGLAGRIAAFKAMSPDDKKRRLVDLFFDNFMYIFIILAVICITIKVPAFLSLSSIVNIISLSAAKLPIALGIAGAIILTGTDLSAGRIVGLTACISAACLQMVGYANKIFPNIGVLPIPVVLVLVMAVGALVGLVNGWFVAKFKLHPFIVTLSTQMIVYGCILMFLMIGTNNGNTLSGLDASYSNFIKGTMFTIGGVAVPWYILYVVIITVIMWVIWNKTSFGKNMFAVGSNEEAANVSGVNVKKTIILVFVLAGIMYALTGFIESARIGSNNANTGLNYDCDAIAACVIGGVSFVGGIGKIRGVIIGVVLLRIIFVGLTFMSVSSNLQYIIKGLIILVACAIDMRKYLVRK